MTKKEKIYIKYDEVKKTLFDGIGSLNSNFDVPLNELIEEKSNSILNSLLSPKVGYVPSNNVLEELDVATIGLRTASGTASTYSSRYSAFIFANKNGRAPMYTLNV